jgi:hypothetical protein
MDRKRRAHERRIERLALDQAGILHAAVVRIHRTIELRGPKPLQGIDEKIEHGRRRHDARGRAEKNQQISECRAHQNLK